ncbi:zinc transporter ZIP13-like [Littorina saxatilis]|uniref:zinc transporter ZIP13-like n=1 Tax=Littorina saxatilis TaxID=31220 RepID=UPI0038B551EA
MYYRYLYPLIIALLALTQVLNGEIHRAKTTGYKGTAKRASHAQSVDVAYGTEMEGRDEDADATWFLLDADKLQAYDVWIYSILGAILVGLSGILPLLIMPIEAGPSLKHGAPAARLKLMLSFAVGSLLGDVFCHLLPEVWNYMDRDDHGAHTRVGLWVIGGLLFFMIVEKLMADESEFEPLEDTCDEEDTAIEEDDNSNQSQTRKRNPQNQSSSKQNVQLSRSAPDETGTTHKRKRTISSSSAASSSKSKEPHIKVSGYLNLFANVVDNFTHGLAVAGSFLVSRRVGLLTTGAILVHEIPHEIGDFAILLRSGFDRWKAAKAQILTATGGVFGAITALTAEQAGERTAWILAFTSGGFLYIALVTVVPDLLQEKHGWESLKQIFFIILGILCMVFVTYFSA